MIVFPLLFAIKIQKRSHETLYEIDTRNKAIKCINLAITKLEAMIKSGVMRKSIILIEQQKLIRILGTPILFSQIVLSVGLCLNERNVAP